MYQEVREVAAFITAYALSLLAKLWQDFTFVQTLSKLPHHSHFLPVFGQHSLLCVVFPNICLEARKQTASVSQRQYQLQTQAVQQLVEFLAELLASDARICYA
jgi:hypothetical protein